MFMGTTSHLAGTLQLCTFAILHMAQMESKCCHICFVKTKLIWVSFSSGNSTLFKLPTLYQWYFHQGAFYDSEIYRPGALRFVSVLSCICTVVIVSCLIGMSQVPSNAIAEYSCFASW